MPPVDPNELLTKKSLALSLAPPRAPPHDTPHRSLLTGLDPHHSLLTTTALVVDDENVYHQTHSYYTDHTLRQRFSTLLPHIHLSLPRRLPHPHLPAGPELGDRMTRALGSTLSLERQNALRDGGGFRRIVDTLVTLSVPGMAIGNPKVARKFLELTNQYMSSLRYGRHPMQKIDLLIPPLSTDQQVGGLLFFVHGGAWGSGLPWMYRLVAGPFMEELNMAVAIVGYRTFPDADVAGQVEDLERAADALYRERKGLFGAPQSNTSKRNICLIGHSSGAHISLLMLVNQIERRVTKGNHFIGFDFTSYIGLSGPYDINHHFDYEAGRGVEELSPMKPACGFTRHSFQDNSPAPRLLSVLSRTNAESSISGMIGQYFPPCLLVHGIEDSTVPFTATSEAARIIRSCGVTECDEEYLSETGHQETVMELILGGKTRDAVMDWFSKDQRQEHSFRGRSKL